jgi:DNA-binding IclR family transcriptional regulator
MTTDTDLILSALSLDEPVTRAEMLEATGLDAKTLSNRLFALHTKGLIAKNPEGAGWLLSGDSAKRTQHIPKIIPAK